MPVWIVEDLSGGRTGKLTDSEFVGQIGDARRTVLAMLVALGGAFSIWLAYDRHRLDRDANVTDRYAVAISQLGGENLSSRLGGLFALERVAVDATKVSDRVTISQVLSAFVNDRSPRHGGSDYDGPWVDPGTDTLEALSVLSRLGVDADDQSMLRLDLSYCAVPYLSAPGLNLRGAEFQYAQCAVLALERADLSDSVFEGARIGGADGHGRPSTLSGVVFDGSNADRLIASNADFNGTSWDGARLEGAHFTNCTLVDADFGTATLHGARFTDCDLRGADLSRVAAATLRLTQVTVRAGEVVTGEVDLLEEVGTLNPDSWWAGVA